MGKIQSPQLIFLFSQKCTQQYQQELFNMSKTETDLWPLFRSNSTSWVTLVSGSRQWQDVMVFSDKMRESYPLCEGSVSLFKPEWRVKLSSHVIKYVEASCVNVVVDVWSLYLTWREMSSNINDLWHLPNQGLLPLHYLCVCTQIKPAATGILLFFILNVFFFPWCATASIKSVVRCHDCLLQCQMTDLASGLHCNRLWATKIMSTWLDWKCCFHGNIGSISEWM